MNKDQYTGGCMCGAIRYEITGKLLGGGACYCRDCQLTCGGAPAYAVVSLKSQMRIQRGVPKTYVSMSATGNQVSRYFCGDCGTPLFGANAARPDYVPVMVGSLDDASWFNPQLNSWVATARPWHHLDPAVPAYDGNIPSAQNV